MKNKRNWILAILAAVLLLSAAVGYADAPVETLFPNFELDMVDPEYSDELQQALDALQAHTPGAVVDYAIRERDDGRYEWDLFFTLGNQFGQCELWEEGFELRRVRLYDMPQDGLTAREAMAALAQAKGDVTIIDLELERDDGSLRYEGEATLNGKRYEFDMRVTGKIVEWERD